MSAHPKLNLVKPVDRQLSYDEKPKEFLPDGWMALLLANIAFLIFSPSLHADLVYDAVEEIINEGFITSISNLPSVLSLKVMSMPIMLQDRPGQLLYMMLDAGIWGKNPFGYHLSSNLLHAANVGLLFFFLCRLLAMELAGSAGKEKLRVRVATAIATLVFALHPIAVETVSAVSYCGDLLATFFTLLALITATYFRPDNLRTAVSLGSAGAFCAFAAVLCKESGLTTWLLLAVYWYLFRRKEPKKPWLLFLGAAMGLTLIFLAALRTASTQPNTLLVSRLHFAPSSHDYLDGSFWHVFLIQPALWVFMMGKLVWPTQLSADYTLGNASSLTQPLVLIILVSVVTFQFWLGSRSRIGSLGVAMYWFGLVTVSNFMPLYRPVADRFYYLPLAGVSLQLLALLLLAVKLPRGFYFIAAAWLAAIVPITQLNVIRQRVFENEFQLWTDTARVSPDSWTAQSNLGAIFMKRGRTTEAALSFQRSLQICPGYTGARFNLASLFLDVGRAAEAIPEFKKILNDEPKNNRVRSLLGIALAMDGQTDNAITEFKKVLQTEPTNIEIHCQLGVALSTKGQTKEATAEFRKILQLNPNFVADATRIGTNLMKKGKFDEAIVELHAAIGAAPLSIAMSHTQLGLALLKKDKLQAGEQFQEALKLDPDDKVARDNLALLNGHSAMAPKIEAE